jgi:hypothetical protein
MMSRSFSSFSQEEIMKRWMSRIALTAALVATGAVGAVTLFTEAQAGPCRCPLIYAPVICDHGKTYPNQCVADCHNAKNCVPTGEI